jgi:hypothetical protein
MKPLSLSDRQSTLVRDAAKAVPISKLDEFLQQLARHLGAEPSDAAQPVFVKHKNDFLFRSRNRLLIPTGLH